MNPLRAALDEMAANIPVYGDLDRAIEQVEHERRRRRVLASLSVAAAVLLVIAGTLIGARALDSSSRPIAPLQEPSAAPLLVEGPLSPGRYRYVLTSSCDDPPTGCPGDAAPTPPLDIELTVPAGWQQLPDYPNVITLADDRSPTEAPDGAALVLGWTNSWVNLYSEPCRSKGAGDPDIAVGPSVKDFVDAVQAHDILEITQPSDVRIGGHPGRFFTLRAPADISGCEFWRPWDPGFYAQGPSNIWDVWAIDVDGFRVLVVANYYPGTPARIPAQLREMVGSITFRS